MSTVMKPCADGADCENNVLIGRYEEALQSIVQWSEAYPLDIFPEPDLKKAAAVLKANGLSLDAISATAMRRVVDGVGKIAKEALDQ